MRWATSEMMRRLSRRRETETYGTAIIIHLRNSLCARICVLVIVLVVLSICLSDTAIRQDTRRIPIEEEASRQDDQANKRLTGEQPQRRKWHTLDRLAASPKARRRLYAPQVRLSLYQIERMLDEDERLRDVLERGSWPVFGNTTGEAAKRRGKSVMRAEPQVERTSVRCDDFDDDDGLDDSTSDPTLATLGGPAGYRASRTTLLIVVNSHWANKERRRRQRALWLNTDSLRDALCGSRLDYELLASSYELSELWAASSSTHKSTTATTTTSAATLADTVADSISRIDRVEYLFALGDPPKGTAPGSLAELQTEIDASGDVLVMDSVQDEYRALTLKHLSIYKWALDKYGSENPSNDRIMVLKCDDDAQVQIDQMMRHYYETRFAKLFHSLQQSTVIQTRQHRNEQSDDSGNSDDNDNWMMCAQFPPHTPVLRDTGKKWQLTRNEWPYDTYPPYCSGLAYLAPLQLIRRLFVVAHIVQWNPLQQRYTEPLWIDDVYITGHLVSSIDKPQVSIGRLNAFYCYTVAQQSHRRMSKNIIGTTGTDRSGCMVSEVPS